MLKKFFTSFYFMPVFFVLVWGCFAGNVYMEHTKDILNYTKEGGMIEDISHLGYVVLLGVLLLFCDDFKDRVKTWGSCLFLAMCAFLREEGIHHYLSKTDTTPFKSRFFLNPNNPIGEKLIFGLFLILLLGVILYLAFVYAKSLIENFFKLDVIAWSIGTLCFVGVAGKIIDRYPSNFRKANGVPLPDDIYAIFQLVEESSEMFLPYIAVLILWQYHLIKKA